MARCQINNRDQHEQATRHGINDEFQRRIDPARAAPDADEKIHRHQANLPEDIEEEKIQSDEDAEHPGLEQEHEEEVLFDLLFDRP